MSNQNQTPNQDEIQTQEDVNELIKQRHHKLDLIKQSGKNPYPNQFKREDYCGDLQAKFDGKSKEEIESADHVSVKVAGRVMLNRGSFIVIQDMTGRIQLYVDRKNLDADTLAVIKSLDLGDIVAVAGYIGRSGKGDLYVHITELELLTKSLRPLPDKFHGLADTEARYRNRHIDLMMNEETRKTFIIRSQVIAGMRAFMLGERFYGSRNADDARYPWWCGGSSVYHAPQRLRYAVVFAYRSRAVPKTPCRGRF